jgi:hypothetical protein
MLKDRKFESLEGNTAFGFPLLDDIYLVFFVMKVKNHMIILDIVFIQLKESF